MAFEKYIGKNITYKNNQFIIYNGKTEYTIIYGENATVTEKLSAEELSKYLEKISGVKIPVYQENGEYTTKSKVVSIGKTELLNKSEIDYKNIDFNFDGFVIKTLDNTLFLFGGKSQRATLYAVYEYLESCLGCKFFAPNCEFIPKQTQILLPDLNVADIPAFGLREVVYGTLMDNSFSAKSRLYPFPENDCEEENEYGETLKKYIWSQCHNIVHEIIPYEEYGETNPEWFYKSSNDIINFIFSCGLTNDGGYDYSLEKNPIDVAVESLKKAILKTDAYYFQVSQSDVASLCEEKRYLDMAKKYTDSGVMLLFINNVCERLDKWIETAVDDKGDKLFPNGRDYKIITLAYSYTQFPPVDKNGNLLINLSDKVFIWLAPIEFNCLYPYNHDLQYHYVTQLIPNWAKLTKNLGIWDYYSNFAGNSMYYSPYLSTGIENYKFYKETGIYCYVLSEFSGWIKGPRNISDEVKTYVASKLMWDPYRWNVDELVKDFCSNYFFEYGDVAYTVLNNMEQQIDRLSKTSGTSSMCHSRANWSQFFPLELLKENEKLVDDAISQNEQNKQGEHYETLKIRLKRLKLLFVFNQVYEYDSYYPRHTQDEKTSFYKNYFILLEEANWDDYVGKTSDFFTKNEKEHFCF